MTGDTKRNITLTVCRAEELGIGMRKVLPVGPFGVGVFNVNGALHALINHCPHASGQVCLGRITGLAESPDRSAVVWLHDGEILTCPWHGWEFDIGSGRAIAAPDRRLKKYPVYVRGDDIVVELPASYAAQGAART